jgi:hypothetical protein
MFQIHHIFAQQLADNRVFDLLTGIFDINGANNLMRLPADRGLASQLGSSSSDDVGASPHNGGPLGSYDGLTSLGGGANKVLRSTNPSPGTQNLRNMARQ